jgi:hypothetical protein
MGGFKEWVDGWMGGFKEWGMGEGKDGWIGRQREKVRGVYGFISLVKQNKKAKICFVIYITGFFF